MLKLHIYWITSSFSTSPFDAIKEWNNSVSFPCFKPRGKSSWSPIQTALQLNQTLSNGSTEGSLTSGNNLTMEVSYELGRQQYEIFFFPE